MTRDSRYSRLLGLAAALLSATVVLTGEPVLAACHAFTVEADPATLTEGGEVTVTVSRDAAVDPSQIDVSTVDGTARSGRDYARLRRTVSFTDETEQTFTIATRDDDSDESAERFRVHLSNPGGCAANPSFVVGPDAQVIVRDNDAAPAPQETSPSPDPVPSPTATGLAAEETDGGLSGPAVAGIVLVAFALGALAVGLLRRRGAP